jgi:glycosyltransferase involved in cell wall biosynthesis
VSQSGRYVCAFRGARDRYQAAVALAETGELETLITDAYATPLAKALQPLLPGSVAQKLHERRADGLPVERVRCLWATTVHEQIRHRLGYSPRATWLKLDRRFGVAAAEEARRTRADLLMYSPYAWEAFTAGYTHHPRRVLFQYHPHPALESRILDDDARQHPGFGESFTDGQTESIGPELLARERDSWRHADAIICSSSFTRRSLVEAGCSASICHVVPYGVFPAPVHETPPQSGFRALFVGSGGQRKGLHHLVMAWQRARLRDDSTLTLVCRVMDRGIRAMAEQTPRVEIVDGASAAGLDALYGRSTLFVMPSLVEGFGHVYLEALARGCPVLGTANTALPDLGGEADGIFVTPAGDVAALTAALERLSSTLPGDRKLRTAAHGTAERYPWHTFRANLRAAIH